MTSPLVGGGGFATCIPPFLHLTSCCRILSDYWREPGDDARHDDRVSRLSDQSPISAARLAAAQASRLHLADSS